MEGNSLSIRSRFLAGRSPGGYGKHSVCNRQRFELFDDMTLMQVLNQGGGKWKAFGRHAVAALLNATAPWVAWSEGYILSAVQIAVDTDDWKYYKGVFESANEMGLPGGWKQYFP